MSEPQKQPSPSPSATPATRLAPLDKLKITFGVLGTLAGVSVIVVMIAILANRAVTPPQIAGIKTPAEREELLRKARAEDHQTLTTYAWVDRQKGVVRIPIDVAMQKLIAEGGVLPATSPASQPATSPERNP